MILRPSVSNLTSTLIASLFLLLILALPHPTTALSPSTVPLFCKCTCGLNSTIIPLNTPPPPSTPPSTPPHDLLFLRSPSTTSPTCADCTRSFCASYNLPICKDTKEEDITTTCFARDAVMDRVLVWGFLLVTVGLIAWAGVRGCVGR
ncbi:hypothetical protein BDZ91DRAFT_167043 [Kalaharituber pfeilii]|nr:hypothetical protein BDZ91DRAFT_167043 [Kalaharituber pfeilii]